MTKLAPIEELAKNITSLEVCNGIVYFSTEVPIENGEYKSELVEVTGLIKELRQAIIKDFVSKAEVKAALIDDPLHLNGITKDDAAIKFYSLRGKATKLYALPEWSK